MSAHPDKIHFKSLPSAQEIDLIILDLGGVLLEIDYTLTQEAFAALGLEDIKGLYSKAAQNDLFDNLETGSISPSEFRAEINRLLDQKLDDSAIDDAWNALIQRMPEQRLKDVIAMRVDYRTCLLSNTNEIHISCFESLMDREGVTDMYKDAFEQIFYSSRIGCRKPHKEAFSHVLDSMGVRADKALFIDDSIQHLQAASQLGIHSYHLEVGKEDISTILSRFRDGLA